MGTLNVMSRQIQVEFEGEVFEECGICSQHVEMDEEDDAIVCDGICGRKCHVRCTGISADGAKLVGDNINLAFVCNNCSVLTPTGLNKSIEELASLFKKKDDKLQKFTEEMLRKQDNLNTSVKLYMTGILADVQCNKNALGKLTTAMKTLFESCDQDKQTLCMITKHLKDRDSDMKAISEKIDRMDEQTSHSVVEKHLKNVDSLLESQAELTLNLVNDGVQRHREVTSAMNNRIIAILKKKTKGESLVKWKMRQYTKALSSLNIATVNTECGNQTKEIHVSKKRRNLQPVKGSRNKAKGRRKKKIKNDSQCGEVKVNQLEKVEVDKGCIENVEATEMEKAGNNEKFQIIENVMVSKFDSMLNTQILKYNKCVEASNLYLTNLQLHKIKVVGLSSKWSVEEIKMYMRRQNTFVMNESYINVLQLHKNSRKSSWVAEMEVDGALHENMMKEGYVYIKWDRCKIFDLISVRRCYNCSGFNHNASICKRNVACPRCSGDHVIKECTSSIVCCINCVMANDRLNLGLDVSHEAWNRNCEVYKRRVLAKVKLVKANM